MNKLIVALLLVAAFTTAGFSEDAPATTDTTTGKPATAGDATKPADQANERAKENAEKRRERKREHKKAKAERRKEKAEKKQERRKQHSGKQGK